MLDAHPENVKFIFESPDQGKTVYRREFGTLFPRELWMINGKRCHKTFKISTKSGIT